VAEGAEQGVLGYALFRRVLDEAELLRLAVQPAARCRGIGRRLQEEGLQHLRRLGVRTAHLEVRCDNEAAIHIYETSGWRRHGVRRRYYRDGTDALIYRLDL
jgi:[ribosomal protein S18]-alanine N-acetyltransferase